jgi:isochorismate synthase
VRGDHELGRFRAERLGPAFDLLAAYRPGGFFMERSGLGVAGDGLAATSTIAVGTKDGWRTPSPSALLGGVELVDHPEGAPPPFLFGSIPFEPGRNAVLRTPARAVRRDREGETWSIALDGAEIDVGGVGSGVPGPPGEPFSDMQLFPEPTPDMYKRAVSAAVDRIRTGGLDKVVLARTLRVDAGRALDPTRLVRRLRAVEPDGYAFAFDLGDDRVLVGASPELLVSRFGSEVRANPLAGSAPRFGDVGEDRASAERLGSSAKDRQEHAVVVEAVARTLQPLCSELRYDREPQLLATANVWHLSTRFHGLLRDPAPSSLDLVAALHPTPAVGGDPTDRALELIRELEPVPRGAYAGAIGWMDASGDGVWALALRCAELAGSTARLFAGAGIVADSDPAGELDETERKFRAFLDSLRWG